MHELTRLANKYGTDKGTEHFKYAHAYTEFYGPFLKPYKKTIKNMLEIGILECASMKMWRDFFPNTIVTGLENTVLKENLYKDEDRLVVLDGRNAYSERTLSYFVKNSIKFDFILDDGPHDMPSWSFTLKHYTKLLTENGILMIEDIGFIGECHDLIDSFDGDKTRLTVIDRTKTSVNVSGINYGPNRKPDYILLYM